MVRRFYYGYNDNVNRCVCNNSSSSEQHFYFEISSQTKEMSKQKVETSSWGSTKGEEQMLFSYSCKGHSKQE